MKTLVIDALIGAGFSGSFTLSTQAERAGLAYFSGSQGSTDWTWSRSALEALPLEELQTIYAGLRAEREMQAVAAAEKVAETPPRIQVVGAAYAH